MALSKIYFSRIDSDDLFHKNFVRDIKAQEFKENTIIILDKGYLLVEENPALWRRIKWWFGRTLFKKLNRIND